MDMEHHRKEKDSCLASESSTGPQGLKFVMRTLSPYTFRVQNVTHARVRHRENSTSALVGSHMRRRLFKSTPTRMHWEELDASDCRLALQQRAQRGACGDHVARCEVHMPAQTFELQRLTRSCAPIASTSFHGHASIHSQPKDSGAHQRFLHAGQPWVRRVASPRSRVQM